jgi:hypothetical protein
MIGEEMAHLPSTGARSLIVHPGLSDYLSTDSRITLIVAQALSQPTFDAASMRIDNPIRVGHAQPIFVSDTSVSVLRLG